MDSSEYFFSHFSSHSWGISIMKLTGLALLFKWENLQKLKYCHMNQVSGTSPPAWWPLKIGYPHTPCKLLMDRWLDGCMDLTKISGHWTAHADMLISHLPSPVRVRPTMERYLSGTRSISARRETAASSDTEKLRRDRFLKRGTTR